MQTMLLRRGASICKGWRQHGEVLSLARSASGSPANEDFTFEELAEKQKPKPSASKTETLFGIAPIKVIDEENEDFVPPSMPAAPAKDDLSAPAPPNYFSKTWELQKPVPFTRLSYFVDHLSVSSSPQPVPFRSSFDRVWQVTHDLEACSHETFTFASLKVLSQDVANKHKGHLYSGIPVNVLDWKSRRRKLLSELDQLAADIICLQELDKFQDLQSDMAFKGYAGLFKASSTGRASCGCAIFWKQKRFHLLHEESIDFGLLDMRNNVAQLCVLQSTVPGTADNEVIDSGSHDHYQRNRLIVGNIEVLFNPKRGDIKLGQCRTFLQQAHKLSNQWPGTPLIIGGCFHATPQSAIYQFLAESKVDVFGLEAKYVSGHLKKPAESSASPVNRSGTTSVFGMDLRRKLRTSLLVKSISSQDANAVNSVDLASGKDFDRSPGRTCDAAAKAFVSKTVEILESCIKSKASPSKTATEEASSGFVTPNQSLRGDEAAKHDCPVVFNTDREEVPSVISVTSSGTFVDVEENGNVEDISAGINKSSETLTDSVTDIVDSDSVKASGSAAEPVTSVNRTLDCPSPVDEVPKHDVSPTSDADAKEFSIVSSPSRGETSADISSPCSTPQHGWDPEDLRIASGSKDCTLVKHDLNLFSVYPEIPGQAETRNSKGEPCMTMVHNEFKGTVDYIWRSEGLKTMKVLDTFSKKEILGSPTMPFMVSGSDHLSLACELGFCAGKRRK